MVLHPQRSRTERLVVWTAIWYALNTSNMARLEETRKMEVNILLSSYSRNCGVNLDSKACDETGRRLLISLARRNRIDLTTPTWLIQLTPIYHIRPTKVGISLSRTQVTSGHNWVGGVSVPTFRYDGSLLPQTSRIPRPITTMFKRHPRSFSTYWRLYEEPPNSAFVEIKEEVGVESGSESQM